MRILIITLILLHFLPNNTFSQELGKQPNSDSSKITLESVDNFYKIPKDDFDKILDNRIKNHLEEKVNFWLGVGAIFVALLGFFGITKLPDLTSKEVKLQLQDELNKFRSEYDQKSSEMESLLEKRYKKFSEIQNEVDRGVIRIKYNEAISDTRKKYEDKIPLYEPLVSKAIELGDYDFAGLVLNELAIGYFYGGELEAKKLLDLVKLYGSSVDISAQTFMNIAIKQYLYFELYNRNEYRTNVIYYCDNALLKNPIYGEAMIIKICVFSIDYIRENTYKDVSEEQTLEILTSIAKGTDNFVCSVFMECFNRRYKQKEYKRYLNLMEEKFPQELELIRIKARDYDENKKEV